VIVHTSKPARPSNNLRSSRLVMRKQDESNLGRRTFASSRVAEPKSMRGGRFGTRPKAVACIPAYWLFLLDRRLAHGRPPNRGLGIRHNVRRPHSQAVFSRCRERLQGESGNQAATRGGSGSISGPVHFLRCRSWSGSELNWIDSGAMHDHRGGEAASARALGLPARRDPEAFDRLDALPVRPGQTDGPCAARSSAGTVG
jgi:hypothetical protein